MSRNILKERVKRRILAVIIISLMISVGCDGDNPCSRVQNGEECIRDSECREDSNCWCGFCILEECTGSIEFRDRSLEYFVRATIGLPNGDIRYEDVRDLKVLHGDCIEKGICIGRLDGIQCLTSLQELYLSEQFLTDIYPLSSLSSMEKLSLDGNRISDVSPLSNMTAITELDLSNNEIVSIAPMAGITSLKILDISSNQVSDLSSLGGMAVLETLDISINVISDYGPLSGLTSLVELYGNGSSDGFADISSLSNLTALEILELGYNDIIDLSPLTSLVHLFYLDLHRNEINDVGPLVDNQGISVGDWVDIYNNPIDCFEQSANIQELRDRGVVLDTSCP